MEWKSMKAHSISAWPIKAGHTKRRMGIPFLKHQTLLQNKNASKSLESSNTWNKRNSTDAGEGALSSI
jgi:hypothetical protein